MTAPASLRLAAQMVAVLLAALTLALLWGLATSATDRAVASQPFRSQPFRVAYEPFEFRASQPFRVASQPFASQPF